MHRKPSKDERSPRHRAAAPATFASWRPMPTRNRAGESERRSNAVTSRRGTTTRTTRAEHDPGELLRGARSVICVAVPYATPEPAGGRLHGRVSNYAWSPDYHRRLHVRILGDVAREWTRLRRSASPRSPATRSPSRSARSPPAPVWVGSASIRISSHRRSARSFSSARSLRRCRFPRTRRCARAAAIAVAASTPARPGAARRLHDRRQPVYLRSHAAHRCHSRRHAFAARRLGLGMRPLPARVPADEGGNGPAIFTRVGAARSRRSPTAARRAAAVAQRRVQAPLPEHGHGLARRGGSAA